MKVYSHNVFDWRTCTLESCVEQEYSGPVLECKKDSQAPPPPDPNVASAAQTRSNRETAEYNAALNRFNTITPLGSQTYRITGTDPRTGAPIYEQQISLSPEQQQLYDQQVQQNLQLGDIAQGMMGQVAGSYRDPISTAGLPALTGNLNMSGAPALQGGFQGVGPQMSVDTSGLPQLYGGGDLAQMRQGAQDALYDLNTAYLDPQFQRSEEQLRARLANQGIVEGSEAYRNALDDFNREKEMAYRQARNESIAGAGSEAERLFGLSSAARGQLLGERFGAGQFANQAAAQASDLAAQRAAFSNAARSQALGEALAGGQFGNQARAQGMQELFALRNQPLNEFNALRSAAPVQMPSFSGPAQISMNPTDVAGNIYRSYQGQLDAFNAQQASRNSLLGGLFNLGGALGSAAILASDERVKEDIHPVGELNDGTELFSFRYKGRPETHVGVMAQKVEKTQPDAVHTIGGVKHVDYAKVLGRALQAT